jgi:anthranilate phosphoribosyltransferase
VAWHDLPTWRDQALRALQGEGPLADALLWNLAAYLWLADLFPSLEAALAQARALLAARSGETHRLQIIHPATDEETARS